MLCDLLLFSFFSVPIVIIDIKTYRIPDWLSITGSVIYLLYLIAGVGTSLWLSLAAGVLSLLLFLLVRRIAHNGLGLGDVKFAVLIGIFCGIPGFLFAFLFSSVSGLLCFLILAIQKKYQKSAKIPFAPFLFFGAISAKLFIHLVPLPELFIL